MKVTILMGCSGSGKSTYASKHYPEATVCSADTFFMVDGEYRFNPKHLGDAHSACLREYVAALGHGDIVVDNTNTTVAEIAPYAALALAWGYDLEIVHIECDPVVANQRNAHGVARKTTTAQHYRIRKTLLDLPPWWPVKTVNTEK